MSDIDINRPGTPIITKVAKELDKERTDSKAAINYVGRVYRVQSKLPLSNVKIEEKDITVVVTANDVIKGMNREILD